MLDVSGMNFISVTVTGTLADLRLFENSSYLRLSACARVVMQYRPRANCALNKSTARSASQHIGKKYVLDRDATVFQ